MKLNGGDIKLYASFGVICAITILCFFGKYFTEYLYWQQNTALGPSGPSFAHIFGTDVLGRDILSRILYGGKISLAVGFAATCTAIAIGTTYGMIAGYCGGVIDNILMRIVDVLYPLPLTLVVILLMALCGNNLFALFVAIGSIEWLTPARIIRAQVANIRNKEFVLASRVLGQTDFKILVKHILPNILDTIIVYATLTMPSMMLLESFLSFLGIGVRSPRSSWGVMMSDGSSMMESYPSQLIFTCMVFVITLFSLNVFGNCLRDKFDPMRKNGR